jgi:hypothetical protein
VAQEEAVVTIAFALDYWRIGRNFNDQSTKINPRNAAWRCNMRIEKDSLGEKQVPENAWYGIHTSRSMENFNAAGEAIPLELVYAIARLKAACATANERLGLLDQPRAEAIRKACEAILSGVHDDQFPIDIFQAGSGTSTHMNVNEVIANLAAVELGGKGGQADRFTPTIMSTKGSPPTMFSPLPSAWPRCSACHPSGIGARPADCVIWMRRPPSSPMFPKVVEPIFRMRCPLPWARCSPPIPQP